VQLSDFLDRLAIIVIIISMADKNKNHVLVVGGGFGGVKAALELAGDSRFEVTLLSDRPDFRYYPTLYHAATGGLRAGSSIPLGHIFAGKKVKVILGKATTLDRHAKTLATETGRNFTYDTLILALGVVTNYFGVKGLDKYSFGIKSPEDAERLKAHLHQQLTSHHQPDLNYVIVGAGPTGVELAGALPAYLRQIMKNHRIKRRKIHIDLVETAPRVLPNSPKDTSRMVARRLRRLGVKLYLGQTVQGETADDLMVSGRAVRSHTVIWTAGVTNNPFFAASNFAIMGHGKVGVNVYLQADRDIYVIGDNANTPFSGMAQTAINDADFVTGNLGRTLDGKQPKSYMAKQPVSAIPVGPGWATVDWGKLRIHGKLGWMLRSAADFNAFRDYEPLFEAAGQWLMEFGSEEECSTCATSYA
jgi:NADH:quinone reductase (non-electrogenic)